MKTPVCLLCVRSYKNENSRDNHGHINHGAPSARWKGYAEDHPTIVFEVARPGVRARPQRPAVQVAADPEPTERLHTRTVPPKEQWNQAEGLEALPWVKHPKSAEVADRIATLFGHLASELAPGSEEHAIVLSQRDFYLAYGSRMRRQKAAA